MHDKNIISPKNNVAFRIPSTKLTVVFYSMSHRNPPARLHYSCLVDECEHFLTVIADDIADNDQLTMKKQHSITLFTHL